MRSFWSDPYLWIHLAGLAAFPLFLEACLIGFAMGDPFLPVWLELLLVAVAGVAPILWMQWQRPFYIFSLVAASVKPGVLTDDQRRLLALFKLPRNRGLAVLVAIVLLVVLQQIYALAPIAAASVSFLPASHGVGLLVAAVAFLACNLFVQVPVSVASVMLSSESAFAATPLYSIEQVRRSFTIVGLQLKQILPPVLSNAQPAFATMDGSTAPSAMIEPFQSAEVQSAEGSRAGSAKPATEDFWTEPVPVIDASALDNDTETSAITEAPHSKSEADAETDSA